MEHFYSIHNVFAYYFADDIDAETIQLVSPIIKNAFDKWDTIIMKDSYEKKINIKINIAKLDSDTLGYAGIRQIKYFGEPIFGNTFPDTGEMTINSDIIDTYTESKNGQDKSQLYYVILHEIGHILGIGTLWDLSGSPIYTIIDNSGTLHYLYNGENAFREYKQIFNDVNNVLLGIPLEDDGGEGTINSHPEENGMCPEYLHGRYIENVFHPGLGNELMTGWIDSFPAAIPLSRITIGFLNDLGYTVNYELADNFIRICKKL